MTREELVPHIAKAIRPKWLGVSDRLIADIAGIALEEAAKVCDREADQVWADDEGIVLKDAAAAIRALKEDRT